jgi:hypothetical protein
MAGHSFDGPAMNASQKRAVANHRRRLTERGLARYEVRGLECDKELVRNFAKRLAENNAKAEQLRREVAREIAPDLLPWPRTGKDIWDALRRSPLVGADLDFSRELVPEREIDL